MDASWKGLGWCAATDQRPVAAGLIDLSGRSWRWPALRSFLEDTIANEIVDLQTFRGPADPPPFLAIEKPPPVYSTPEGRGDKAAMGGAAGNQSHIGYGMGTLSGALQFWWDSQGELGYPWEVEPRTWRKWWGIGGRGRSQKKASAIRLVEAMKWGRLLEGHSREGLDFGHCGDVAESILLAVGAAQRGANAPVGPKRKPTRKR